MSNANRINGFKPVGHLFLPTELMQAHEYTLTSGNRCYEGDVLKAVAAGTVEPAAAGIALAAIGIAAHYADDGNSTATVKVMVYDDPYIIFAVQADTSGTPAVADVFSTADHVAGSGNATTKQSGHQLKGSDLAAGTNAQFKVVGLVDEPDNAWGANAKLKVMFNEHFFHAAVAGV
jgi:hypothetical protein